MGSRQVPRQVNICGIHIDNLTMAGTLQKVLGLLKKKKPALVVTPNVDHIVKLQKDSDFLKVYRQAALTLCDGVPLIWASKFLGTPIISRVNGTDLFVELCRESARKGLKVFLLGGRPQAADRAAALLKSRNKGLKIAGTYCPPYGFENDKAENTRIIKKIRAARPDILFVGLGAPKQEKWMSRWHKEYRVPVSVGIGVSFEFVAGMVKLAPGWMRRNGLEWLWRLLSEPGRLWKRYLLDDPIFFYLVLKQKLTGRAEIRSRK